MTPMCEKTTDEKHTMTPCCSVGAIRVLGEMRQSNLFQDGNIHTPHSVFIIIFFLNSASAAAFQAGTCGHMGTVLSFYWQLLPSTQPFSGQ